MGVRISNIHGYFEYSTNSLPEQKKQVFQLAKKVIHPLIKFGLPINLSHIFVATSCPDMLSPSLGQMLKEEFNDQLASCQSLDIIQGCTGGVSAMIIASQICELNESTVLVINADAAKKATSRSKPIHRIFGNGSFSCLIGYDNSDKRLIYSKSKQYNGLSEVITINLGHDSDEIIMKNIEDIKIDPRKHLGLSMNNVLAKKLFSYAEGFFKDFIKESQSPDIMILHQVNPIIMKHLERIFAKYKVRFINVSKSTGNCGAASVGIALDLIQEDIRGQKVLLCSFGTGGVITAGLWQF